MGILLWGQQTSPHKDNKQLGPTTRKEKKPRHKQTVHVYYLPSKLDISPFLFYCLLVQCVQTFGVCLHISTSSTLWHQREPVINSVH